MLSALSSESKQAEPADALKAEVNQLQAALEAETGKCKKLLGLLDDTVRENDIVRMIA